jgi:hypothetical protein
MFWKKKYKKPTMRELVIKRIEDIQDELYAIHQNAPSDLSQLDYSCLDCELLLSILTNWERTKHKSDLLLAAMQNQTNDFEKVVRVVIDTDAAERKTTRIR